MAGVDWGTLLQATVDIATVIGIFAALYALWYQHTVTRAEYSRLEFVRVHRSLGTDREVMVSNALDYYRKQYSSLISSQTYPVGAASYPLQLLAEKGWVPDKPLLLSKIILEPKDLSSNPGYKQGQFDGIIALSSKVWPFKARNLRYSNYSETIEDLDRPRLFDDRYTYRLVTVEPDPSQFILTFRVGKYFDYINTGEALAFELQSVLHANVKTISRKALEKALRFRKEIGSPTDFDKRCASPAISTLTLFERKGKFYFIMLDRSAVSVAVYGGYYHVVPAGEFQAAIVSPNYRMSSHQWGRITNQDFGLWRNMLREYYEELTGVPEVTFLHEDYATLDPYRRLNELYKQGSVVPYFLGVGIDPTNLKPEILTACVFFGDSFEKAFPGTLKSEQVEGILVFGPGNKGLPFDEDHVSEYLEGKTLPQGKACLELAWYHQTILLTRPAQP